MFARQSISVNLVPENASILKRPSKLFNKIKAGLTQSLTPTEAKQAEVMLSVMQRLNSAVIQCGISEVAKIEINDKKLYQRDSGSLQELQDQIHDHLEELGIKKMESLKLVLKHNTLETEFVITCQIFRKPETHGEHVKVSILGMNSNFEIEQGATKDEIHAAFSSMMDDANSYQSAIAILNEDLTSLASELQSKINKLFPAKSTKHAVILKTNKQSIADDGRFDDLNIYPAYFWYQEWIDLSDNKSNNCDEKLVSPEDYEDYVSGGDNTKNNDHFWEDTSSNYSSSTYDSSCSSCSSCGGD